MLNLADWAAQNPCCYISSQGRGGHCSDSASEAPLLLCLCSMGALWDQDFTTPHHVWNQSAHCSVHHTQVPSHGFDLPSLGMGCCYSIPHLWVLNHNSDFYHWGGTAAVPHPFLWVLSCGFVPISLEHFQLFCKCALKPEAKLRPTILRVCCYYNLPPRPKLLLHSVIPGPVPMLCHIVSDPRSEPLWRFLQGICTGWHIRHQCHCHSKVWLCPRIQVLW